MKKIKDKPQHPQQGASRGDQTVPSILAGKSRT